MSIPKHPCSKLFRRMIIFVAALAALSLIAGACGGGEEEEKPEETAPSATAPGGGEKSFEVSMGDNFFELSEFSVSAGSDATFDLTNDGAAIHNMRVAGKDNDYATDDDSVSDPDVVSGGDSAILTWAAPDEPGEYRFRCDFHPSEMTGTITVE